MYKGKEKILIIRLSSFGDIVQCMGILGELKKAKPNCEIHWVVKSEFAGITELSKNIDNIWSYEKKTGLLGWLKLVSKLRKEGFTHVYDAHSNPRSHILSLFLRLFMNASFRLRPKERLKRILLFTFRKNLYPQPFKGAISYLAPIRDWIDFKVDKSIPNDDWKFSEKVRERIQGLIPGELVNYIAIAPSAAWELKRWPVNYWQDLIRKSDKHFLILGGPSDSFCEDIAVVAPERTINLAGKTNLVESCYIVSQVSQVISGDTGILHVADILGIPTVALIGPSAFGFPSSNMTTTLETPLYCRPCSKDGSGKCINSQYKKCMYDIKVDTVLAKIQN